jgi:hypothetical protein
LLARAYPGIARKAIDARKTLSTGFDWKEISATRLSFALLIDYARDWRAAFEHNAPFENNAPFEHDAPFENQG